MKAYVTIIGEDIVTTIHSNLSEAIKIAKGNTFSTTLKILEIDIDTSLAKHYELGE